MYTQDDRDPNASGEGAPQQPDPFFDNLPPPTSSANPAGVAPGPGATTTTNPAANGGTLNFTPGMTDDQVRSMVNDYLAAQGVTNIDNGQYWVDHYRQYGSNDPAYFTSQLQKGVADKKNGVSSGSLGGGAPGSIDFGGFAKDFTAPSAEDARNTPGYQFQLGEGINAIQNSAFAKGTGLTGGTLKGITRFASGLADSTYGDTYNRAMQQYLNSWNIFRGNEGDSVARNQFDRTLGADAANKATS